jgi:hypothetical protein
MIGAPPYDLIPVPKEESIGGAKYFHHLIGPLRLGPPVCTKEPLIALLDIDATCSPCAIVAWKTERFGRTEILDLAYWNGDQNWGNVNARLL